MRLAGSGCGTRRSRSERNSCQGIRRAELRLDGETRSDVASMNRRYEVIVDADSTKVEVEGCAVEVVVVEAPAVVERGGLE